jgi:hypothetical protein
MDPILTCAELRAQITLDRPTREDLERVNAALGARSLAIVRLNTVKASRALLASEQRDMDAHSREFGDLANLAAQLEDALPMNPEDRKMRFGSPRYPSGAGDLSNLKRLSREHSTVDWLRANGARATTTSTPAGRHSPAA